MNRVRTVSAGILLTITLTLGPGMSGVASAATVAAPTVVATGTIDVCGGLADVIGFLEGRPSSRLRDYLLAQAQRLSTRHCAA